MVRRIAKLPFKLVKGLLNAVRDGGRDQPFPEAGRSASPPSRPAYTAPASSPSDREEDDDHGHDHGHSHGHSHGHEPEPEPEPAPEEDHGHDHGHGHSHDHGGGNTGGGVSVSFEGTPNPNAMKFMLDRVSVEKGSLSFNSADDAKGNPLGERLFGIPGVVGVFAVADFGTVTKDATSSWGRLTHPIVEALEEVYG